MARFLLLMLGLTMLIDGLTAAEPVRADRYGDQLPPGAIARLGTIRFRHPGSMYDSGMETVFFSPDGKTLITSHNHVYFWSIPEGKQVRRLENQGTWLALSPDGKRALARSDEGVAIVDVQSGKELRKLPTKTTYVNHAVFSPDGRLIAAEDRGQIAILDSQTFKVEARLENAGKEVRTLSFSQDGKRLAVGCQDEKSRVWDVKSGKLLREASGHLAALSADGKILSSYWRHQVLSPASVSVTDVDTGRAVLREEDLNEACGLPLFSSDSKSIFVPLNDDRTYHFDLTTRKKRSTLDGSVAAVSRDDKSLAVLSSDRSFRLIDVATGKEIQPRPGHRELVHRVAFAPDGRTIATTGDWHYLRLWNGQTGEVLRDIDLHPPDGTVYRAGAVGFSPNGKLLATLDRSGSHGVDLWDAHGKPLSLWKEGEKRDTNAWHFSADGKTLMLLSGSTLRLRDIATNTDSRSRALAPVVYFKGENWSGGRFSPDGSLLVQAFAHEVKDHERRTTRYGIWDSVTGKLVRTIFPAESLHETTALAISSDNRLLATSVYETVHLWDLQRGTEVRKFTASPEAAPVTFSADGSRLAFGGPEWTVRVVETLTGRETALCKGHLGPVTSIAFSADGKRLVSGSEDATALIWDLAPKR